MEGSFDSGNINNSLVVYCVRSKGSKERLQAMNRAMYDYIHHGEESLMKGADVSQLLAHGEKRNAGRSLCEGNSSNLKFEMKNGARELGLWGYTAKEKAYERRDMACEDYHMEKEEEDLLDGEQVVPLSWWQILATCILNEDAHVKMNSYDMVLLAEDSSKRWSHEEVKREWKEHGIVSEVEDYDDEGFHHLGIIYARDGRLYIASMLQNFIFDPGGRGD